MTPSSGQEPSVGGLTRLVLGAPTRYSASDLAAAAGVPLSDAARLWRAMGFADVGDEVAFTRLDLKIVKELAGLVDSQHLTFEDVVELVRSVGQTTARLAEWQTDTISRMAAGHVVGEARTEGSEQPGQADLGALTAETEALLPVLQRLIVYAWRRQLATAVERSAASTEEPDPDVTTSHMSVGFADIVGFTRISRELPDEDLAELIESFDAASADIVAATGARLVKTVGDEILFVGADPGTAVETALRLHEAQNESRGSHKLRIGIATGSVISRMGDVFGTTVNCASRLTVIARPQTTFVDAETMAALAEDKQYLFRGVRPRRIRGIGLVRPWLLQRRAV